MTDQGIKSRPKYQRLALDPSGRHHLLLIDGPALSSEAADAGFDIAACETWIVIRRSAVPPEPILAEAPGAIRPFRSTAHLFSALQDRLARETMGLRIYAAGTEDFLWDIHGIADQAGMSRQELRFCHVGSKARRIFCVHCRTITAGVKTSIVACSGCGASLFVRDHFSRRLAAFMGVQVDAEAPGEVPDAEEIYA
ncbi:dimethylamine monooxygenase subunit DmmA family protein [Aquabacter spiritensis]|uniref:Uncharacterized protein n=1 Tax=Aquabacter spiritensis TaxID=933073 RepID=A0A4R3M3E7_9HYPH|nr:dimethylamine monooxygenase subunit DmmA family protein [Aquabacter spiritensis]TCT07542.1 hypothetical protein EDC64_10160 [Aquabacter spiritensis]